MLPRALSLAALPLLASANCPDLGIAAEVACLTSDNTMSATPSFLASGASCPEACTTAWNALIATCPLGTDDWDLDDGATGTAGVAAGWVDMDGEATDANAINVGDAQSVAARIAVKWLALGLDKELCAWANPATNDELDNCGHAQRIMQCVAPVALPLSLICPAADAAPPQVHRPWLCRRRLDGGVAGRRPDRVRLHVRRRLLLDGVPGARRRRPRGRRGRQRRRHRRAHGRGDVLPRGQQRDAPHQLYRRGRLAR